MQDTIVSREFHSAVSLADRVLLIGGLTLFSNQELSSEFIPVDGSVASPGPFTVRHREGHCTMRISEEVIVVTGGELTDDLVTEYQLTDGRETALTPMTQRRYEHACGVYKDANGEQVSEDVETRLLAVCEHLIN